MIVPELTIRRAGPEDLAVFTGIVQTSMQETYVNPESGIEPWHFDERFFEDPRTQKGFAEQLIQDDERMAWIAGHAGHVVGVLTTSQRASHIEMHKLHVVGSCKGKGVGSALMRQAFGHWGDAYYGLDMVHYNRDALVFYQNRGFGIDLTHPAIRYDDRYPRDQWPVAYEPGFWSYRMTRLPSRRVQ